MDKKSMGITIVLVVLLIAALIFVKDNVVSNGSQTDIPFDSKSRS